MREGMAIRSMGRRGWLGLLLSALPLLAVGCSGKTIDDSDPAALFKDAEADIKNDQYLNALEKLKTIRNKFPYSRYFAEAQLRIADVSFLQDSFGEAAAAYESFRDLHPKHEKTAYAMFRIGESYSNDAPGNVARDQSSAKKAEEAYTEFLKRFPTDPQADAARKNLAKARSTMAQKELYIGNFYLKQDQLDSAKRRFEKLIATYPDTEEARAARDRLGEVERARKNGDLSR